MVTRNEQEFFDMIEEAIWQKKYEEWFKKLPPKEQKIIKELKAAEQGLTSEGDDQK